MKRAVTSQVKADIAGHAYRWTAYIIAMKTRELAGWMWIAALCGTMTAIGAAVFWAAIPRERVIPLGYKSDFPIGQPVYRALDPDIVIYLVNLDGQLIAWDGHPPLAQPCSLIKWVPTTNRFEDPCSGDKWCLDGTIADSRYAVARTLDRYLLEVDHNNRVWLHTSQKIRGTSGPDYSQVGSAGNLAFTGYHCEHLQE